MAVQPLDRLLLLERRRRARSTRWCSRSRTRRGANATGTSSTPAPTPARNVVPKAMHVSPFLPMDVDYQVSWTAPGDDVAPGHRRRARGRDDVHGGPRVAAAGARPAVRALGVLAAPSRPAAARVARDLPPSPGAVPRPRARIPSSVPTCAGDPRMNRRNRMARAIVNRLLQPPARRHARARRPDRTLALQRTRPPSDERTDHVRVDVHDLARRTSESCAKAASAWASRTRTAGGTPTTSPSVLRLALRSLRTISERRDALHRLATPSSTRSHDCGEPTSTATRATCARTTTSATTSSSTCSTRRWRTRARSSTLPG